MTRRISPSTVLTTGLCLASVAFLVGQETFATMLARDKAGKSGIMARQLALLEERYDLQRRVSPQVAMHRGKPVPVGPPALADVPGAMT